MDKHVTIIGAGVIGLTLAKELAINGIDVEVYDSKKTASEGQAKASGILSITGLKSAGLPYKKSIINTLNGAVLHAGRETLKIRSSTAMAYVVDRGLLAESCMGIAKDAGATVTLGKRFSKDDALRAAEDKGNILVGADGAVSTVASAFGFPSIDEYVLTYKAEYERANIDGKSAVNLFFSNEISNGFFGWAVPHSSQRIEIGLGISGRARANSYTAFKRFLGDGSLNYMLEGSRKVNGYASVIPLGCRKVTAKGNVLLVGDAAGQVKSTTGGGIIFGSLCAKVLARSITNNIKRGSPLSLYEREWKKKYGAELKLHSILHSYYSSLDTKSFEILFKLSKMFGTGEFLGKYGDMDRPSLMLKRFFLRGLAK